MSTVDVLVVGGGPVGLTAAAELRRHGVEWRIVDRLAEPPQYAKAIGVWELLASSSPITPTRTSSR